MAQTYDAALAGYQRFEFAAGAYSRTVFQRGEGPAVVVIHEIPGLHPPVIRFAERVIEAGMTVYLPVLFGEPGRPVDGGYLAKTAFLNICVRREFNVWRLGRSSPIVDWLRALARRAHDECGGRGAGAVGMCFTGGFALAMATDPAVVAPVLSQPSLPLAIFSKARAADIDVSRAELDCVKARFEAEDLSAIGLRFRSDRAVPDARFERLRREFGKRFEAIELDARDAAPSSHPPHGVLTIHLREDGPTKQAEQRVIAFLKARTAATAP